MRYVIGIDQGFTKTHSAISDENGNILAACKTDGAEQHITGLDYQVCKILETVRNLLKQTGIKEQDVSILFGGLSGIDWPEEPAIMENQIKTYISCKEVYVVNDSIVALRGGTSRKYGAIICAGTGANCAVISPEGEMFTYGFYMENAIQGGSALGRHVMDIVFKSAVGRIRPTVLTDKVMKNFGIYDMDVLVRSYVENRLPAEKITNLAIDLFVSAYEGDEVSVSLIRWYGLQLAGLVNAKVQQFHMEENEFETIVSGSIFKGPGTLLQDVVDMEIHAVCPRAVIVNAKYEPVVGAIKLALEKLHKRNCVDWSQNIESSSLNLGLLR